MLEHSPVVARTVATGLRAEGFAVDVVRTLSRARTVRRDVNYDCLVLDQDVADGDSLTLTRELRRADDPVPIVIVSSREESEDRVRALTAGADDYLTRPVNIKELVLRVRKLVVRKPVTRAEPEAPPEVIGRLVLTRGFQEVCLDGEPVALSATQYCLVEYLLTHRHREVSADELLAHCWDANLPSNSRPLPPQITRVRAAFRGTLVLELVRYGVYRVWVDGEKNDNRQNPG